MTLDDSTVSDGPTGRDLHRLRIDRISLIGGGRDVDLLPGLNIVRGDITTGKTTFVRLLRAVLGKVPDHLPPETDDVAGLRAKVRLSDADWEIYRPLVTTQDSPVEVARIGNDGEVEGEALRLPALGFEASYSRFLLDRLSIPAVSVPRARLEETSSLTPVTMTDWLGYCIIPGDELDYQVFGSREPFRNQKRRWVFELVYGYYDTETARLIAERRKVDLRIDAIERQDEIVGEFLAGTNLGDRAQLEQQLAIRTEELATLREDEVQGAQELVAGAEVGDVRTRILALRQERDALADDSTRIGDQLLDLSDLRDQLQSQSARLTRAIVSDEWLVDFDFLVCPRCGTQVDGDRAPVGHCYLCLQPESPQVTHESLLDEQSRVAMQVTETQELIETRTTDLNTLNGRVSDLDAELAYEGEVLDQRTAAYVSDAAGALRATSAAIARAEADINRLDEYLVLHDRRTSRTAELKDLRARIDELDEQIDSRQVMTADAEGNVQALERRMLDYLRALHIPQLGDLLTVSINRTTYLPEVSNRTFDELSSQGLKTLVNVAHALAHHTVAIDRGLPLPGFLVLDGISANSGTAGFDGDRIEDIYRLLLRVSEEYGDQLQLIAVDNEVPVTLEDELADRIALTLKQEDRLIRPAAGER